MEIINHFSHEKHPLSLKELQAGDNANVVCYGCKQPVLGSTYCCNKCEVFLHKSCAELPLEITLQMHPQHSLKLLSQPPYRSGSFECDICYKSSSGFVYNCSTCEFDVDVLCAQLELGGAIILPYHHHPVKLQLRSALFTCDACYVKEEDQSYCCTVCSFWIHKTCGSLPSNLLHEYHPHPLVIAYCFPEQYRRYGLNCDICRKKIYPNYWEYYCAPCRYFVHIKCITSYSEEDEAAEDNSVIQPNVIHLPVDAVSYQLIQHFLEEIGLPLTDELSTKINHFSHDHPLILANIRDDYSEMDDDNQETVCSGCGERISGSCYGCVQCNYFIHLHCAQLPKQISHAFHPEHKLSLNYYQELFVNFDCSACGCSSNVFFYECKECGFFLDIKCALLPPAIKHEAHNHLLVRSKSPQKLLCNACCDIHREIFLSCKHCEYNLATLCATLPRIIRHKWDKHPLVLRFSSFYYHPNKFICNICKEEIHREFWLYYCRKCNNSFHPYCIPRLCKFPNMKFEGEVQINYHPHPLTIMRDVKYKSSCDNCGDSLEGYFAFECEPCYFKLCQPCVCKIVDSKL